MIKMSVRENDGFEFARIDRRRLPVLLAPLFRSLEHSAVDEDLRAGATGGIAVAVDEMFRTSDCAGCAQKL